MTQAGTGTNETLNPKCSSRWVRKSPSSPDSSVKPRADSHGADRLAPDDQKWARMVQKIILFSSIQYYLFRRHLFNKTMLLQSITNGVNQNEIL